MAINRRGQALVELAISVMTIVIVVSAVANLTIYMCKSLDGESEIRAKAGKDALNASGAGEIGPHFKTASLRETVEVDAFAAKYLFGTSEVEVSESVSIPAMSGL